ncbi:MAG: phosphatidylglycerophosphatase A [Candidatus Eisenbacteria bacterium]|nr:phosphatidylglycerophosphatase A [Candidatus Eisenbacteria bacterium]
MSAAPGERPAADAPRRSMAALAVASFGGAGFFPIAPATFATFVLYGILGLAGGWRGAPSPLALAAVILAVSGLGVWASREGERAWGEDAGRIVIDEVAGALITIWGLSWSPEVLGCGFLAFRAMDIIKPPPAYQIQALPHGWGVMADDIVAGIYAQITLRVLLWSGIL